MKAAYYELASNTKYISDQAEAIANTFYLVKEDLYNKRTHLSHTHGMPSSIVDEQSEIEKENRNTENFSYGHELSHDYGKPQIDTHTIRQIESLKNELNLIKKIKETLEKQLQESKKTIVSF